MMPGAFFNSVAGLFGIQQEPQQAQGQDAQAVLAQNAIAQQAAQTQLGNLRHQMIIQQDMGGLVEYRGIPPRQNIENILESIHTMAQDWCREGLEFTEIIVPPGTYHKLRHRFGRIIRYTPALAHMDDEAPREQDLIIATAMGYVKFTCEDNKSPKYNLDKYMETVE